MSLLTSDLWAALQAAGRWTNDNEGVISVGLFVVAALYGWVSGIFGALRRKPKFRIDFIERPGCSSSFVLGLDENDRVVHRTAIVVYLRIANIGSAAATVDDVEVGYKWAAASTGAWWQRRPWYWLRPSPALEDFRADLGGNKHVFPFLIQRNHLVDSHVDTYLHPGAVAKGVVYYESPQSWGAAYPAKRDGKVEIKVRVRDGFGAVHISSAHLLPDVTLEEARRFNPEFGNTNAVSHASVPDDASTRFVEVVLHAEVDSGGERSGP